MEKTKMDELCEALRVKVESLGYDSVGFEFSADGGMNVLRVYVDMPGGIDLSDCETISEGLGEYLDSVESAMPDGYFLEVSSPGLERPLFRPQDYRRFINEEATITLQGGKSRTGVIKAVADDSSEFILDCPEGEEIIAFSSVKRAKLVYKQEKGQKKTFKKLPKKKK